MFRFLTIALIITVTKAGNLGYGGYGGYGLGTGGIGLNGGAVGIGGLGLAGGLGYAPGPVSAAIASRRTYELRPFDLPQDAPVPQVIEVEPSVQPVEIIFRTISSPVLVQQIHTPGAPGQVEATNSQDEPHRVLHEVLRPVIQEVREVIQPYRKVVQEVRPVLEEVHTVVAKGDRIRGNIAPVAAPVAVAAAPIVADVGPVVDAKGLGGLSLGGGIGLGGGYKSAKKAAKA